MEVPSGAYTGCPAWTPSGVIRTAVPLATSTSQIGPADLPSTTAMVRPSGDQAGAASLRPLFEGRLSAGTRLSAPVERSYRYRRSSGRMRLLECTTRRDRPLGCHAGSMNRTVSATRARALPESAVSIHSGRTPYVKSGSKPRQNTTRVPSGDHLGSCASALSRTASVSGTASPPPAGSFHSWPTKSSMIQRPSGERSNARLLPS